MDGREKARAKGQRGSDSPATRARRSTPLAHTPDDVGRPPCEFVHRIIMLKSTQGEDATT